MPATKSLPLRLHPGASKSRIGEDYQQDHVCLKVLAWLPTCVLISVTLTILISFGISREHKLHMLEGETRILDSAWYEIFSSTISLKDMSPDIKVYELPFEPLLSRDSSLYVFREKLWLRPAEYLVFSYYLNRYSEISIEFESFQGASLYVFAGADEFNNWEKALTPYPHFLQARFSSSSSPQELDIVTDDSTEYFIIFDNFFTDFESQIEFEINIRRAVYADLEDQVDACVSKTVGGGGHGFGNQVKHHHHNTRMSKTGTGAARSVDLNSMAAAGSNEIIVHENSKIIGRERGIVHEEQESLLQVPVMMMDEDTNPDHNNNKVGYDKAEDGDHDESKEVPEEPKEPLLGSVDVAATTGGNRLPCRVALSIFQRRYVVLDAPLRSNSLLLTSNDTLGEESKRRYTPEYPLLTAKQSGTPRLDVIFAAVFSTFLLLVVAYYTVDGLKCLWVFAKSLCCMATADDDAGNNMQSTPLSNSSTKSTSSTITSRASSLQKSPKSAIYDSSADYRYGSTGSGSGNGNYMLSCASDDYSSSCMSINERTGLGPSIRRNSSSYVGISVLRSPVVLSPRVYAAVPPTPTAGGVSAALLLQPQEISSDAFYTDGVDDELLRRHISEQREVTATTSYVAAGARIGGVLLGDMSLLLPAVASSLVAGGSSSTSMSGGFKSLFDVALSYAGGTNTTNTSSTTSAANAGDEEQDCPSVAAGKGGGGGFADILRRLTGTLTNKGSNNSDDGGKASGQEQEHLFMKSGTSSAQDSANSTSCTTSPQRIDYGGVMQQRRASQTQTQHLLPPMFIRAPPSFASAQTVNSSRAGSTGSGAHSPYTTSPRLPVKTQPIPLSRTSSFYPRMVAGSPQEARYLATSSPHSSFTPTGGSLNMSAFFEPPSSGSPHAHTHQGAQRSACSSPSYSNSNNQAVEGRGSVLGPGMHNESSSPGTGRDTHTHTESTAGISIFPVPGSFSDKASEHSDSYISHTGSVFDSHFVYDV